MARKLEKEPKKSKGNKYTEGLILQENGSSSWSECPVIIHGLYPRHSEVKSMLDIPTSESLRKSKKV